MITVSIKNDTSQTKPKCLIFKVFSNFLRSRPLICRRHLVESANLLDLALPHRRADRGIHRYAAVAFHSHRDPHALASQEKSPYPPRGPLGDFSWSSSGRGVISLMRPTQHTDGFHSGAWLWVRPHRVFGRCPMSGGVAPSTHPRDLNSSRWRGFRARTRVQDEREGLGVVWGQGFELEALRSEMSASSGHALDLSWVVCS